MRLKVQQADVVEQTYRYRLYQHIRGDLKVSPRASVSKTVVRCMRSPRALGEVLAQVPAKNSVGSPSYALHIGASAHL